MQSLHLNLAEHKKYLKKPTSTLKTTQLKTINFLVDNQTLTKNVMSLKTMLQATL